MDTKDPTKSLQENSLVVQRLHGPNVHKAVHAEAAGRGHSPDNPRGGPHFQLRSARDAEVLWVERDGFHGLGWYAGGVEVVECPEEALQQPGDRDSTSGVSTPSPTVRSRQGIGLNSRCLPTSPDIPDYRRQRTAKLARPKILPRPTAMNARNRGPW